MKVLVCGTPPSAVDLWVPCDVVRENETAAVVLKNGPYPRKSSISMSENLIIGMNSMVLRWGAGD